LVKSEWEQRKKCPFSNLILKNDMVNRRRNQAFYVIAPPLPESRAISAVPSKANSSEEAVG
jgi:hypothetical protein